MKNNFRMLFYSSLNIVKLITSKYMLEKEASALHDWHFNQTCSMTYAPSIQNEVTLMQQLHFILHINKASTLHYMIPFIWCTNTTKTSVVQMDTFYLVSFSLTSPRITDFALFLIEILYIYDVMCYCTGCCSCYIAATSCTCVTLRLDLTSVSS